MNLVTLQEFAKAGESVSIEYKSSTAQVKSACETLSAFLNAEGGKVFIGIADNGAIIGQEVTDKTKRLIGNEVAKISPAAKIDVEYLKLEGKKFVIILSGSHQPDKKPYMYDGRAYIRVETNTLSMPQEYYNSLLSTNSYNNASHWEDHVIEDVTIEDLDEKEIIKTIKEGVNNGRIPGDYTTDDVKEALKHLRLLKDDKITAAAVVLFAKSPQKWLSQCLLKLARFQGNSHLDDFVDSKQIFGNAFSLIHELMTFSSRYLPVASSFPENLTERKDVPLFPIKVLREVFANAICHRDYTFVGGSIEFGIYDNRLEIWNYGLFPQGIPIANDF